MYFPVVGQFHFFIRKTPIAIIKRNRLLRPEPTMFWWPWAELLWQPDVRRERRGL